MSNRSSFHKTHINAIAAILAFLFLMTPMSAFSTSWNLVKNSIPLGDIQIGGPPKDGIPALFSPRYSKAADAKFMHNEEQILGVYHNGIARAYPTRILSHHELVNDSFGGDPLLVSW